MKKTLTLLLCAGVLVYSGCKKEKTVIDDVKPCDQKTWYEDADGDGLGNPDGPTITDCDQPTGYVLDNTDPIDKKVEQKQVPIMIKFTGETCPPCGAWGWTAWTDLSNKYYGKAFCWANYGDGFSNNHFRSQELNPTMDSIEDRFFSGGKPSFHTNNTDFDQSTNDADAEAAKSIAETAKVAAVLDYKIEGDQLTVTAEVEFFENMDGDYNLGAYLVEDKPVAYQAGHADKANTKHHLVMRGSLSPGAWGEQIITGGATAGQKVVKTFTATIPSNYDKDHFSYGVVIWRKLTRIYLYTNAYTTQGL